MRFGNFFGDGKVQAEKLYEKLISDEEEKVNYANTQSAFFLGFHSIFINRGILPFSWSILVVQGQHKSFF